MTRLLIGVDGGGTGCRARIEDMEGCVLGTALRARRGPPRL